MHGAILINVGDDTVDCALRAPKEGTVLYRYAVELLKSTAIDTRIIFCGAGSFPGFLP